MFDCKPQIIFWANSDFIQIYFSKSEQHKNKTIHNKKQAVFFVQIFFWRVFEVQYNSYFCKCVSVQMLWSFSVTHNVTHNNNNTTMPSRGWAESMLLLAEWCIRQHREQPSLGSRWSNGLLRNVPAWYLEGETLYFHFSCFHAGKQCRQCLKILTPMLLSLHI